MHESSPHSVSSAVPLAEEQQADFAELYKILGKAKPPQDLCYNGLRVGKTRMHKPYGLIRNKKTGIYSVRYNIDRPVGRGYDRTPAKSTHTSDINEANEFAKANSPKAVSKLPIAERVYFRDFAKGWWQPDHPWVTAKEGKRSHDSMRLYGVSNNFSRMYLKNNASQLEHYILPYFGKMKLAEISSDAINSWLGVMQDHEPLLSASTINHAAKALRVMFNDAISKGYIESNPIGKNMLLTEYHEKRGIITDAEFARLTNVDLLNEIWEGDFIQFAISLLAANTGVRCAEIQGLQLEHCHLVGPEPYIDVVHTWRQLEGDLFQPKAKSYREIPIPEDVARFLSIVISRREYAEQEDLVFYGDHGRHERKVVSLGKHVGLPLRIPIDHGTILSKFYAALDREKINREARNIVFHSWRHSYVTALERDGSLDERHRRSLTGHKSDAKEGYVHLKHGDLKGAVEVMISRRKAQ